jgi:hypothetical protein
MDETLYAESVVATSSVAARKMDFICLFFTPRAQRHILIRSRMTDGTEPQWLARLRLRTTEASR